MERVYEDIRIREYLCVCVCACVCVRAHTLCARGCEREEEGHTVLQAMLLLSRRRLNVRELG